MWLITAGCCDLQNISIVIADVSKSRSRIMTPEQDAWMYDPFVHNMNVVYDITLSVFLKWSLPQEQSAPGGYEEARPAPGRRPGSIRVRCGYALRLAARMLRRR